MPGLCAGVSQLRALRRSTLALTERATAADTHPVTAIYWFQHDLRLRDNPGLLAHSSAEQLLLVYFWPRPPPWCNVTGLGPQRYRFLQESVLALQEDLAEYGQQLLVLKGSPQTLLPILVRAHGAQVVGTSRSPGYYERRTREQVAAALAVPLRVHGGNTLYGDEQLPFNAATMPGTFTPFKNGLEGLPVTAPVGAPTTLPPAPAAQFEPLAANAEPPHIALPVRGGSRAGHRRLRQWTTQSQGIANYKETRNCLDGLDGSSTLSPWLALGCLSAREVAAAVDAFETSHTCNESTRWMLFELLWREFFHWRALHNDIDLFRAGGTPGQLRRCTFEPRNFARWCSGDTNYSLVNALMRQLLATGWMSNRGRQIAASCLVNEYGIDWRYGAAFFEKHLIDYDVASNYGNWQYIAGVGADPRGGRHFNQEKQAATYDPDHLFTRKWGGLRPAQPDYITDAADWPLPS